MVGEDKSAGASVILDCGAHHLRAGYGGEHGPRLDIPALVGHHRNDGVAMAAGMNELNVGEEALLKRGMLTVDRPVRDGRVHDWKSMEKLWSHVIFSELRVTPENHCFLMPQSVDAPAEQKEKTLELIIETYQANALFLGTSQVLSLYGYGLTTGLVVDGGRDRTLAVPVHEGYALGRHVTQTPVAGEMLTQYLGSLLKTVGYSFGTAAELTTLNQAKEQLCYVQPTRQYAQLTTASRSSMTGIGFGDEYASTVGPSAAAVQPSGVPYGEDVPADAAAPTSFYLPDGQRVPLTSERYEATEALFDFSRLSRTAQYEPPYKVRSALGELFNPSFPKGLSWLLFAAISQCESTLRPQLYANMVLAGNSLAFPGTRSRLEDEVVQLYRENHASEAVTPIHVQSDPCGGYAAWLGCSILSQLSSFPQLAVSRAEYEEEGLRVVHYKCM